MREQSTPSRCADILQETLQGLGLGRVVRYLALLQAWDRVIACRIKERARVEDFREGRLYLGVEDPIWLHELHMLRHTLKTILNEEVGEPVVGEIVLRIWRAPRYATAKPPARSGRRVRAVPTGVEASMTELLTPLKDLPCHDSLERLLHRWAARSI